MRIEEPLSADYLARFGGIGRLYGAAALPRLRAANVCVIGVGGVGSWVVEALARSGIGALSLVDADDVCITNTNRQLPALTGTVGRSKVDVLAERVQLIAPECKVVRVVDFYTTSNAREILTPAFSFVVDAVDRASTKAHLLATCRSLALPVLTSGAAGGRRNAGAIRIADLGLAGHDELLRQVRRNLRQEHGWPPGNGAMGVPCVYSVEAPTFPQSDGSCAATPEEGESLRMDCASGFGAATHITGIFGFAAAAEVVRRIAGTPYF